MAETRAHAFLDFEKPIAELEGKIEELRHLSDDGEISIVQGLEIDDFSRGRIDATAAELVAERDTVAGLGLI